MRSLCLTQVWAYKSNGFRLVLTLLAILCTGILALGLALYWYRHWWVMVSKQQCTLEEAETVIVIDHYKVTTIANYHYFLRFATIFPGSAHHPICENGLPSTSRGGKHGGASHWRSWLSHHQGLQVCVFQNVSLFPSDIRWFSCKKNRYFWDAQEAAFFKVFCS